MRGKENKKERGGEREEGRGERGERKRKRERGEREVWKGWGDGKEIGRLGGER